MVNENSTAILRLTFTDEDGNPVTPITASYRIGTKKASFSPSASTHDLTLTPEDTAMTTSAAYETRTVTVSFGYGADKQGTGEYSFKIKNLSGI